MTPAAFRRWRLSQRDPETGKHMRQQPAAEALGVSKSTVQKYEKGTLKIPLTVRLACAARSLGIADYDGPDEVEDEEAAAD